MHSCRSHSASQRPHLCPDCDGPSGDHRHEPPRPPVPQLPASDPGGLQYEQLPDVPQHPVSSSLSSQPRPSPPTLVEFPAPALYSKLQLSQRTGTVRSQKSTATSYVSPPVPKSSQYEQALPLQSQTYGRTTAPESQHYDRVIVPGSQQHEQRIRESRPSERLQTVERIAHSNRLRSIEDEQLRLRGEMNQFREDTVKGIKLLASSILGLQQKKISLENSLSLSLALVQSAVEETHRQMLQSSDLLGKQVLDLRRDLDVVFKMPQPVSASKMPHPAPASNMPHPAPAYTMPHPAPASRMPHPVPVVRMSNPVPVPHRSPVRKPERPPMRKY